MTSAAPEASVRVYSATDLKEPSIALTLIGVEGRPINTIAVEAIMGHRPEYETLEIRSYSLLSDTGAPVQIAPVVAWAAITPGVSQEQEFNTWYFTLSFLNSLWNNVPSFTPGTTRSTWSTSRT